MKSYKLINRIGTYWVIAADPTAAEDKLMKLLNTGNVYGFYENRKVCEIHLVADQIEDSGYLTNKYLVL